MGVPRPLVEAPLDLFLVRLPSSPHLPTLPMSYVESVLRRPTPGATIFSSIVKIVIVFNPTWRNFMNGKHANGEMKVDMGGYNMGGYAIGGYNIGGYAIGGYNIGGYAIRG